MTSVLPPTDTSKDELALLNLLCSTLHLVKFILQAKINRGTGSIAEYHAVDLVGNILKGSVPVDNCLLPATLSLEQAELLVQDVDLYEILQVLGYWYKCLHARYHARRILNPDSETLKYSFAKAAGLMQNHDLARETRENSTFNLTEALNAKPWTAQTLFSRVPIELGGVATNENLNLARTSVNPPPPSKSRLRICSFHRRDRKNSNGVVFHTEGIATKEPPTREDPKLLAGINSRPRLLEDSSRKLVSGSADGTSTRFMAEKKRTNTEVRVVKVAWKDVPEAKSSRCEDCAKPKSSSSVSDVTKGCTSSPTVDHRKTSKLSLKSDVDAPFLSVWTERLILLQHSVSCTNRLCPVHDSRMSCSTLQPLMLHILSCDDPKCQIPTCSLSRASLAHFLACKRKSVCPVCRHLGSSISTTGDTLYCMATRSALATGDISCFNVSNRSQALGSKPGAGGGFPKRAGD